MPLTKADVELLARTSSPAIRQLVARELEPLRAQLAEVVAFLNGSADDDLAGLIGRTSGRLHARVDELEARVERLQASSAADKPSGGTRAAAKPRVRLI